MNGVLRSDIRLWPLFGLLTAVVMAPSPAVSATGACTYYDGKADDLLAAGLGATGLAGGTPAFADPEAPTATELRRHAKYNNYRALIATSAAGGFGTFFGPTVANTGGPFNVANDGKIAGWECLEYADKPWARRNVTMMVQVPDSFNPDAPCIVTAPSSGSRGVYGAIGTSGEWGLTNAQHLDAFIGALPGYDELYIPLHVYFVEALNLMYDHLMVGTSLPASQVVHTLPRGAGAPPLTAANIPPIAAAPAPDAQISFGGNVLTIPE